MERIKSVAPGITATPSVSSDSRRSILCTSAATSRCGASRCTTSTVRTPCAIAKTFSGSMLFSVAHRRHSRETERVESTNTPSRSKRIAEQLKIGMCGGGALPNDKCRSKNSECGKPKCRSEKSECRMQTQEYTLLLHSYFSPLHSCVTSAFLVRCTAAESHQTLCRSAAPC